MLSLGPIRVGCLIVVLAAFSLTAAVARGQEPERLPGADTAVLSSHGDVTIWVDLAKPEGTSSKRPVAFARRAEETTALAIRPPRELDLGAGAGRTAVVYRRCTPAPCRLYSYDLDTAREVPVRSADRARGPRLLPSVWAGRVAYAQGDRVLEAPVRGTRRPRTLFRERGFAIEDVELGRAAIATVSVGDTGAGGNGSTVLTVRRRDGSRPRVVSDEVIGESCATGIGALHYEGRDLVWKEARRCGCGAQRTSFHRLRDGRVARRTRRQVPLGVRYAAVDAPETPEGELCEEER